MRVFVMGPIVGKPRGNRKTFEVAASALERFGYTPMIPHWFMQEGASEVEVARRCIETVIKCDSVATLDGVNEDPICRLITDIAKALNMPMTTLGTWTKGE